jgi:hypothetical protein
MRRLSGLFLFILAAATLPAASYAQGNASASASQTVQLTLAPSIDLSFVNSSSTVVGMTFSDMNHFTDGLTSAAQQLRVRSNMNFKISVQAASSTFSYVGSEAPSSAMPVDNTLFMSVTANNTGGSLNAGFNNSFKSLSAASQDVVVNADHGGNQTLTLAYQAKPGLNYPAGAYSVGVLYTATQP